MSPARWSALVDAEWASMARRLARKKIARRIRAMARLRTKRLYR